MISCDICGENVATYSLQTNKIVYVLMPVDVGSISYTKAEWIDTKAVGEGLTKFIHDKCLTDAPSNLRKSVLYESNKMSEHKEHEKKRDKYYNQIHPYQDEERSHEVMLNSCTEGCVTYTKHCEMNHY